jgi:hypothetical protein
VKKDASIQFDGAWLIFKEMVDEEFVGKGLPCYEPLATGFQLAGMLWLWWSHILATYRPRRSNKYDWHTVAKDVSCKRLELLACGLKKWALEESEPSTATLLSLQPMKKRTNPQYSSG